jgi:hypothetical protein
VTAGPEEWLWSWRKCGVMQEGTYRAFGLDDTGGPPIEEKPWASIRSAIYALAREVYWLDVVLAKDAIVLRGSVTSERVKAAIASLLSQEAGAVRNELEVAAPFEPAGGMPSTQTILADGTGTVTRHPSITLGEAARPGDTFEFTVDLRATAEAETQGVPPSSSRVCRWVGRRSGSTSKSSATRSPSKTRRIESARLRFFWTAPRARAPSVGAFVLIRPWARPSS